MSCMQERRSKFTERSTKSQQKFCITQTEKHTCYHFLMSQSNDLQRLREMLRMSQKNRAQNGESKLSIVTETPQRSTLMAEETISVQTPTAMIEVERSSSPLLENSPTNSHEDDGQEDNGDAGEK